MTIVPASVTLPATQLKHETLEAWIEEEWLVPSKVGDEMMFSDADLARAQLIQDLKDDLGVNDEGVGVILKSCRPGTWLAKGADRTAAAHTQP